MKKIMVFMGMFILLELLLLTAAVYYLYFFGYLLLILTQVAYIVWFTCYRRGMLNKVIYAWLFLVICLASPFVPYYDWRLLFGIPSGIFFFSTLVDIGTIRRG